MRLCPSIFEGRIGSDGQKLYFLAKYVHIVVRCCDQRQEGSMRAD